MHVAKFILYNVARKVDSCNIARKVDAVLREKSLLQVVPCNITLIIAYLEDNFTSGLTLTDLSDHLPIIQIPATITNTLIRKTKYRKVTRESLDVLNKKTTI